MNLTSDSNLLNFQTNVIKSLRKLHNDNDIFKTPTLVVFGPRDSDKSQLLYSLIGQDFFLKFRSPTICQIEIQLRHSEKEKYTIEYKHVTGNMHYFASLQKDNLQLEIQIAEELLANLYGAQSIYETLKLEIHSPVCQDLNYVDLPGLLDINLVKREIYEDYFKRIYSSYINRENSIILKVISASQQTDLKNFPSLSKQLSGNEKHSILVITNIDNKLSKGSLSGFLELARTNSIEKIVFVKNMSLEEKRKGLSLKEIRQKENDILENHPDLLNSLPHCKGINGLLSNICQIQNSILSNFFKSSLPNNGYNLETLKEMRNEILKIQMIQKAIIISKMRLIIFLINV